MRTVVLLLGFAPLVGCGRTQPTPTDPEPGPREKQPEAPKVADFKAKAKEFLAEARAAAKLLALTPTFEEADAQAKRVRRLYAQLPDVPRQMGHAEKVAELLRRLEHQPRVGADLVESCERAAREGKVSVHSELVATRNLAVNVMNRMIDDAERLIWPER